MVPWGPPSPVWGWLLPSVLLPSANWEHQFSVSPWQQGENSFPWIILNFTSAFPGPAPPWSLGAVRGTGLRGWLCPTLQQLLHATPPCGRYNLFTGCPKAKTCTIILRGGAEQFMEETERSLHDAIMIVRRAIKVSLPLPCTATSHTHTHSRAWLRVCTGGTSRGVTPVQFLGSLAGLAGKLNPELGRITQDHTHIQRGLGLLLVPPACPQSHGTVMPPDWAPREGLYGHGHTCAINLLFHLLKLHPAQTSSL